MELHIISFQNKWQIFISQSNDEILLSKMTYEPGSRSITLRRRIFLFCVGLIECCIFGGLIFGWPQLVLLLKEEGIYADLCDSSNGTQPQPLASTAAPSTSERCTEVEFQDQSQVR